MNLVYHKSPTQPDNCMETDSSEYQHWTLTKDEVSTQSCLQFTVCKPQRTYFSLFDERRSEPGCHEPGRWFIGRTAISCAVHFARYFVCRYTMCHNSAFTGQNAANIQLTQVALMKSTQTHNKSHMLKTKYSVSPKKWPPLNVWLWQVQTFTTLHIILHAQALMYSDYWHQILYKSVIPFSRFFTFTKRCQKVQLPAALPVCFLCAVTVFYVNVQHFSSNAICWYFNSWTYQADFYWASCEGKWFVLPVD